MRRPTAIVAVTLFAALLSCSKDSTGPSVTFPTLPSAMLAAYCVQGDRQPDQAISGAIAVDDCQLADSSYFEVWRIRVPATGSYKVEVSSGFDSYLAVFRLESYTSTTATLTPLASDDDSGTDLNALIASVSLQADLDYFMMVNGFSSTDTGPYTVTLHKN